jgi:hypothetical protein
MDDFIAEQAFAQQCVAKDSRVILDGAASKSAASPV